MASMAEEVVTDTMLEATMVCRPCLWKGLALLLVSVNSEVAQQQQPQWAPPAGLMFQPHQAPPAGQKCQLASIQALSSCLIQALFPHPTAFGCGQMDTGEKVVSIAEVDGSGSGLDTTHGVTGDDALNGMEDATVATLGDGAVEEDGNSGVTASIGRMVIADPETPLDLTLGHNTRKKT
ncbi:hypothetical protein Q7C36_013657 [Tachysurus vachellii]|uniref:Uncharacterized protein n=1 Tax=Tachysurus vachellii TaxID=175792 RepID=A0AA88MIX0_TACVA|nr:hypothetical protein Q7C36_013657 [Tachysurus vachellii]